ncbi:putative RNA polymerase II subunit B1 CTD phosphatase RPAP2 [Colletotrichum sp. SAR 10_86]|nr:putative RNA polymerase II subunit B1 CTD phosphatase RPAP2 [Colletotrichum sp. SAR 10_76]KAI8232493.1 putative RNA polymerase II subunit B1 CTD phosphatase RPAP2 [Colletotrichum sp. SAR 10_77]KAI8237682.1 putative RNA polymerase II subunit B1 CTD phosphatase RPAP2 [Colletotrichum sp. SAR 10_86]
MATDARPLKGILKKPAAPPEQPRPDPREIAIQHARIIHQRKELELQILESLALLSEYPTVRGSPRHSSANPAPRDVADFKANVRLFQPSDYDDLIEERNVNGLCGYTLCAQPKPAASKGGQWKLVNVGRSDFDIVNRRESEKWCSKDCQRRALYVKVQLNETAAWERAGIPDIEIELLGEEKPAEDPAAKAARDLANLRLEEGRRAGDQTATLALERGEVKKEATPGKQMTLAIRERDTKPPVEEGAFTAGPDDAHMLVEGHRPGAGKTQAQVEMAELEKLMDAQKADAEMS